MFSGSGERPFLFVLARSFLAISCPHIFAYGAYQTVHATYGGPTITRTSIAPRSERPFSSLDAALLRMIEQHEGKPCPTRKDIREWTGMPRRRIWAYLTGMQYRGLIELECRGSDTPRYPCMRRMRIKGRKWTEWTERRLGGHHQLFAGTKLTSDRMTG